MCHSSRRFHSVYNVKYREIGSLIRTDEVQDPAHGAVSSTGQDSEVRNVPEEVQPETQQQNL